LTGSTVSPCSCTVIAVGVVESGRSAPPWGAGRPRGVGHAAGAPLVSAGSDSQPDSPRRPGGACDRTPSENASGWYGRSSGRQNTRPRSS
jgi:hypothetical protein